jgi:Rrf2 family nitric oxide-sensitive transcriptional repressor
MYLATTSEEKSSIKAIADSFAVSENHLVKVVHRLGVEGFIETTRGRGGGIRLAKDPRAIAIGDVIRKMEPHFDVVECFSAETNRCSG